jgi:4-amino-4-deoxy-L-arabinose transferase-like glycosyltransferase
MASHNPPSHWLNRPLLKEPSQFFSLENLLIFLVIVLAIISRFMILGERVMSHDEVNHVVPSYDLFQGRGYRHDPVTHGPFQFHILALTYFVFGDNDFTARVPAALFSVLAVAVVLLAYRRFLGRTGALIAGLLFVISPYILFYGRYTRNEAFIQLLGVIMLYAMLRYLETGQRFSMYLFTFSVVMHFTVKETSFIYTAQALIFLVLMFLLEVRRILYDKPGRYNRFLLLLSVAMMAVILALAVAVVKTTPSATAGIAETAPGLTTLQKIEEAVLLAVTLIAGLAALFSLAKDIGWSQIKALRSFSLLVLTGTLILPMLSPFPVFMIGWNPLDYTTQASIARTAIFVAGFFLVGMAVGWWWNPRLWLLNALLFYSIFTVLYTTFFTNGFGFFTGVVGSLGYWLSQQGVERGSQPWYYYIFQVSIYEYLPFLGSLLALYFGVRYKRFFQPSGAAPAQELDVVVVKQPLEEIVVEEKLEGAPSAVTAFATPAGPPPALIPETAADNPDIDGPVMVFDAPEQADGFFDFVPIDNSPTPELNHLYAQPQPVPVLALLLFWSLTSLAAYSVAGEKMPWLTVHITLPMLLASGWGLGMLIDRIQWKRLGTIAGLIAVLLLPVVVASASGVMAPLLAGPLPFQGNTIDQLQASSRFLFAVLAFIASAVGIFYLLNSWRPRQVAHLAAVTFFAVLAGPDCLYSLLHQLRQR